MFEFSWPWAFLLLPLPWLINRFTKSAEQTSQRLRMPSFAQFTALAPAMEKRAGRTRWLELHIWACLVTAAANPKWLDDPVALPNEGRDIMFSM